MRILKNFMFCAVATVLLSACGSSKSAQNVAPAASGSSSYGTEIQLNDCQRLAEEMPATRAVGDGVSYKLSTAKNYAELQARAALARAIATKITAATQQSGLSWEKFAGDLEKGGAAVDEGTKSDDSAFGIAKETVTNAVVIKTNQYMQPNRQYHVFVCVEYQGGAESLAQDITEKIGQQVPDEERLKMEYNFKKFQEKIEKELSEGK